MKICDFDLTGTQYENIPENLIRSLELFLTLGCPVGGFLSAVLENDLRKSISFADMDSRKELFNIVSLIYNFFPGRFMKSGCLQEFYSDTIRYNIDSGGFISSFDTNSFGMPIAN